MRNLHVAWLATALIAICAACEPAVEPSASPLKTSVVALDGLDSDELSRFLDGAAEFSEVESVAEGLGPFFNASSCGHCHISGGLGGAGLSRVTRVMCLDADGTPQPPPAGSLLHAFSTRPDLAAPGIPAGCDAVLSDRRTTNVLGAGLLEAIADEELLAEAGAQLDGVSGRAAVVTDALSGDERVGRLGWKAQHATLDAFAGDAYRNELGITNEIFADEVAPAGDQELLLLMDQARDPEAAVGAVGALADFMRFSAPPGPASDHPSGLATFRRIGCASCHRETYPTSAGEARLYSDLLLHDVGTGDGIPQGAALASELRTPPLWGLGRSSFFLHDGSVTTIDAAVLAHAGQASSAREAYEELTDVERGELLEFLQAL